MNTKLNQGNVEFRTREDVRKAAMEARAEVIAETIHSAWRGLQRAWCTGVRFIDPSGTHIGKAGCH